MWLYHRVSKRCRRNGKQCRPWSDCSSRSSLIWVCTVCPGISVRKLRIITVYLIRKGQPQLNSHWLKVCILGWNGESTHWTESLNDWKISRYNSCILPDFNFFKCITLQMSSRHLPSPCIVNRLVWVVNRIPRHFIQPYTFNCKIISWKTYEFKETFAWTLFSVLLLSFFFLLAQLCSHERSCWKSFKGGDC